MCEIWLQDATLLRKQEKEAKRKAQIDAKNRRRHRQTAEEPILTADKDNEDGGRDDINNEHNNDIELDILPDDVLAAIAEEEEAHDNRIKERRIISEQLRAANPQASRRKIFTERHAGPVTVKAIGSRTSTHYRKPSESATSFLQERMYGGVKRSNEMLQPTKIGNSFLYAPKSS